MSNPADDLISGAILLVAEITSNSMPSLFDESKQLLRCPLVGDKCSINVFVGLVYSWLVELEPIMQTQQRAFLNNSTCSR